MPEHLKSILKSIEKQPQAQYSTWEQGMILRDFAIRLGLYDAADLLMLKLGKDALREND